MLGGDDAGLALDGGYLSADRQRLRLVCRQPELDAVLDCMRDPDGQRLVLVRGERGAGRSAFAGEVSERMSVAGAVVLPVTCVPGDGDHPFLLAVRIVTVLDGQATMTRHRPSGSVVREALRAVEQGDQAAVADALATVLQRPVPVIVVVDDAHYADAESVRLLGGLRFEQVASGARLLLTAVDHAPGNSGPDPSVSAALWRWLGRNRAVHSICLTRLNPDEVSTLLSHRLQAVPESRLVKQAYQLSRGIPGAVVALLDGWAELGGLRVIDGHACLLAGTPAPMLAEGDPFVSALQLLDEPSCAVARALSVLWPLGRLAPELITASIGLSTEQVSRGISGLIAVGIVDELSGPAPESGKDGTRDGTLVRGWAFRVPLVERTVTGRLGASERRTLSMAAVEALWAVDAEHATGGVHAPRRPLVLDEADAESYLPDRIADAGLLIDRERAVSELRAAADRVFFDPDSDGALRWLRACIPLIEDPGILAQTMLVYARCAYLRGEHAISMAAAEAILREPDQLDEFMVQQAGCVKAAAVSDAQDWTQLARMAEEGWWEQFALPTHVTVVARGAALCLLERWNEARVLLLRTELLWDIDPLSRFLPGLFLMVAELVLGRPERFVRHLASPDVMLLPLDMVHELTLCEFDQLLSDGDLNQATSLLRARGIALELVPEYSQFLLRHLQGRWDEALALMRSALAGGRLLTIAPGRDLIPARGATILLAQGWVSRAARLIASVRGPSDSVSEQFLDHSEADVHRTLGDLERASALLRRTLDKPSTRDRVYCRTELWATLAEIEAERGQQQAADVCLGELKRIAELMGTERSRLLYLVASARIAQPGPSERVRADLLEAVELARSRSQPFETGLVLLTAGARSVGPKSLLHEAFELFDGIDAALWRFRARAALREAGLPMPGRKQATAENDQLLATLVADGLTNRQIASVLNLSEDAVANRLTRLFSRSGLRSRVEVATALLARSPRSASSR